MTATALLLATVLSGIALTTSQRPPMQDALLENLVGNWHIERAFPNRKAENDAVGEWAVDHHYMRLRMKGGEGPEYYEAHVYITYERDAKRYTIHWMDVFAGSMPESLGYGTRVGDSIVFEWKDAEGTLRNTFAWNATGKTWTSTIEQTGKDGTWSTFCTDTYTRR